MQTSGRNEMSKATVIKVIEGRDFEFRYDPAKMKAFFQMVEEDLALLVLRFPLKQEDAPD